MRRNITNNRHYDHQNTWLILCVLLNLYAFSSSPIRQCHAFVIGGNVFVVGGVTKTLSTTTLTPTAASTTTHSSIRLILPQQRRQTNLYNTNNNNVSSSSSSSSSSSFQTEEAQRLLKKARQLSEEIKLQELEKKQKNLKRTDKQDDESSTTMTSSSSSVVVSGGTTSSAATPPSTSSRLKSIWNVPPSTVDGNENAVGYRLFVDIGREDGTWMDVRWGSSGKRIEFTLDVEFTTSVVGKDDSARKNMVQDNLSGQSSDIYTLRTAQYARLRSGFDRMECGRDTDDKSENSSTGGAYRIDIEQGSGGGGLGGARSRRTAATSTIRFFVPVEGTPERDSSYG